MAMTAMIMVAMRTAFCMSTQLSPATSSSTTP